MFFRVVCSEGGQDLQGQKTPKCLKTLVFSGILCPSERVYRCCKSRWGIWKTPFGKHRLEPLGKKRNKIKTNWLQTHEEPPPPPNKKKERYRGAICTWICTSRVLFWPQNGAFEGVDVGLFEGVGLGGFEGVRCHNLRGFVVQGLRGFVFRGSGPPGRFFSPGSFWARLMSRVISDF